MNAPFREEEDQEEFERQMLSGHRLPGPDDDPPLGQLAIFILAIIGAAILAAKFLDWVAREDWSKWVN